MDNSIHVLQSIDEIVMVASIEHELVVNNAHFFVFRSQKVLLRLATSTLQKPRELPRCGNVISNTLIIEPSRGANFSLT